MQKRNNDTHLERALSQNEDDGMTCAQCEAALADYVQALVEQGASAPTGRDEWQLLERHLAGCPHCTQAYHELRAMVEVFDFAAAAVALAADTPSSLVNRSVESTATPDLSFLRRAAAVPSTDVPHITRGWWQEAGQLWVALADQLRAPLQPGFSTESAYSGLKADSADGPSATAQQVEVIDEPNPLEIAAVTLAATVSSPAQAQEQCTVEVAITIPTRPPLGLSGIAVTLQTASSTLDTQWTDALGHVIFSDVPIAQLPQLYCVVTPSAAD